MATLILPKIVKGAEVAAFVEQMWAVKDERDVIFDFSNVLYAHPFAALLLAAEIKTFKEKAIAGCRYSGTEAPNAGLSYMAHIGFFKFIGIPIGNQPGEAKGTSYIPITRATRESLLASGHKIIGASIQQQANRLAFLLSGRDDLTINRPISYCFREVIRNVFEHSGVDECLWCAQAYYKGEVELAIIDRGRGIRESLAERYTIADDVEALRLAIRPGVSRVADSNESDEWANSGFGLYVLSELGRRTGAFRIASGKATLDVSQTGDSVRAITFGGTAVGLRVQKPKGENLSDIIHHIIAEGERLTEQQGAPKRASRKSKEV